MAVEASILAVGDELLRGDISDKNAALLSSHLGELGVNIAKISIVGDSKPLIEQELYSLCQFSDLVVCSGGLGPTSDDITRDAIAGAAEEPLIESAPSRKRLEQYALKRNRPLTQNSLRQCMFPENAEIIENKKGTADAFISFIKNKDSRPVPIVALPGVPAELEHLLVNEIIPRIPGLLKDLSKFKQRHLRLFGVSESYIGHQVDKLQLSEKLKVFYRPFFPELMIGLSCSEEHANAQQLLDEATNKIKEAIGLEFFYSESPSQDLAHCVAMLLTEKSFTVSAAESCSGGLLAHRFVSIPGSSEFFKGSVVSYSNQSKVDLLGVRSETLGEFGAVSAQTAKEMAEGARKQFATDFALSITGIAGPDGGSPDKPVGRVYIGLAGAQETITKSYDFPWDRKHNRIFSAAMAMELLRRKILGFRLDSEKK